MQSTAGKKRGAGQIGAVVLMSMKTYFSVLAT
jgi:hypothetical protein